MAQEQGIAVGIKNDIARGEFIRATSIEDFIRNENATVKARLLAILGKIAIQLEGKRREEREEIINARFARHFMSSPKPTTTMATRRR